MRTVPRRLGSRLVHDVFGGLRFRNERNAMLIEPPSSFRQRQASACAIKQTNAKFLLQRTNAPAKLRRLRAEAAGSCREAPMLDNLCEELKIIEVGNSVHCRAFIRHHPSVAGNDPL